MVYIQRIFLSSLFVINALVSGVLGDFHPKIQLVVPPPDTSTTTAEQISEAVPELLSQTTITTKKPTRLTGGGTTSSQTYFRDDLIAFFYPPTPGMVWIGKYGFRYNPSLYVLGYPYDSTPNYYKDPPAARFFSLEEYIVTSPDTITSYIENKMLIDIAQSKPLHNQYYSGYVLMDTSNSPGPTQDTAVLFSLTNSRDYSVIFVLTNSDGVFSQSEFEHIVGSARPATQ